jgi:hypothetical protein
LSATDATSHNAGAEWICDLIEDETCEDASASGEVVGPVIVGAVGAVLFLAGIALVIGGREQQQPQPVMILNPAGGISPPAGWYPDPENPGQWRWWDGTHWSEHRAGGPV